MEWLRARRYPLFGVAAGLALLMLSVAPDYLKLQGADDADAFRSVLTDGHGRYIAAAIIDVLFALAYGLVALAFTTRSRVSVAGGISVVLGSIADELENFSVLHNIGREAILKDPAIDLMATFQLINRVFISVGIIVLIVTATLHIRRHQRRT